MKQLKETSAKLNRQAARYNLHFPIFLDFMGNSTKSSLMNSVLFSFLIAFAISGILIQMFADVPDLTVVSEFGVYPVSSAIYGVQLTPFTVTCKYKVSSGPVANRLVRVIAISQSDFALTLPNGLKIRDVDCASFLLRSSGRYEVDDAKICAVLVEGNEAKTDSKGVANFTNFRFKGGLPGPVTLLTFVDGIQGFGAAVVRLSSPFISNSELNEVTATKQITVPPITTLNMRIEVDTNILPLNGNNGPKPSVAFSVISLDMNGAHSFNNHNRYIADVRSGKVAYFDIVSTQSLVYDTDTMFKASATVELLASSSSSVFIGIFVCGDVYPAFPTKDVIQPNGILDTTGMSVKCTGWEAMKTMVEGVATSTLTCTVTKNGSPLQRKRVFATFLAVGGNSLPAYALVPEEGVELEPGKNFINEVSAESNDRGEAVFKNLIPSESGPLGMARVGFYCDGVKADFEWSGEILGRWKTSFITEYDPETIYIDTPGDDTPLPGLWKNPPSFRFVDEKGEPVRYQDITVAIKPVSGARDLEVGYVFDYDSDSPTGDVTIRNFRFTYCVGLTTPNAFEVIFSSDGLRIGSGKVTLQLNKPIPVLPPPPPPNYCSVTAACGETAWADCLASIPDLDLESRMCICRDFMLQCEMQTLALEPNQQCVDPPTRCMQAIGTKCISDKIHVATCATTPNPMAYMFLQCSLMLLDSSSPICDRVAPAVGCFLENNFSYTPACDIGRSMGCTSTPSECASDPTANKTYISQTAPLAYEPTVEPVPCSGIQIVTDRATSKTITVGEEFIIKVRPVDYLGRALPQKVTGRLKVMPSETLGIIPPSLVTVSMDCSKYVSPEECNSVDVCTFDSKCVLDPSVFSIASVVEQTSDTLGLITFRLIARQAYEGVISFVATLKNETLSDDDDSSGNDDLCVSAEIVKTVKQRVSDVKLKFTDPTLTITTNGKSMVSVVIIKRPAEDIYEHILDSELGLSLIPISQIETGSTTTTISLQNTVKGNYLLAAQADGIASNPVEVNLTQLQEAGKYSIDVIDPDTVLTNCGPVNNGQCDNGCILTAFDGCQLPLNTPFPNKPKVCVKDATTKRPAPGVCVVATIDGAEEALVMNMDSKVDSTVMWSTAMTGSDGCAVFDKLAFTGGAANPTPYQLKFAIPGYAATAKGYKIDFVEPITMTCPGKLNGIPGRVLKNVRLVAKWKSLVFESKVAVATIVTERSMLAFAPTANQIIPGLYFRPQVPIYLRKRKTTVVSYTFEFKGTASIKLLRTMPSSSYTVAFMVYGGYCTETLLVSDTVDQVKIVRCATTWKVGVTTMCTVMTSRDGVPVPGKALEAKLELTSSPFTNDTRKACTADDTCRLRNGPSVYATTNTAGIAKFMLTADAAVTGSYKLTVSLTKGDVAPTLSDENFNRLTELGANVGIPKTFLESFKSNFFQSFSSTVSGAVQNLLIGNLDGAASVLGNRQQDTKEIKIINRVQLIKIVSQPVINGPNVLKSSVVPPPTSGCKGKPPAPPSIVVFNPIRLELWDSTDPMKQQPVAGERVSILVNPPRLSIGYDRTAVSDPNGKWTVNNLKIESGMAGKYTLTFVVRGHRSPNSIEFVVVDPKRTTPTEELKNALIVAFIAMLPLYFANHPDSHFIFSFVGCLGSFAYLIVVWATFCDSATAAYFQDDEMFNIYVVLAWSIAHVLLLCVGIGMLLMTLLSILGYKCNVRGARVLQMESRGTDAANYVRFMLNHRVKIWSAYEARVARSNRDTEEAMKKSWPFWKKPFWKLLYKRPEGLLVDDPRTEPIKLPKDIVGLFYPNRFTGAMIVCLVLIIVASLLTWNNIDNLAFTLQSAQNKLPDPNRPEFLQLNAVLQAGLDMIFSNLKTIPGPLKKLADVGMLAKQLDYLQILQTAYIIVTEFREAVVKAATIATIGAAAFVTIHYVLLLRATKPNLNLIRKGKHPRRKELDAVGSLTSAEQYLALQMVFFAFSFLLMWMVLCLIFVLILWDRVRNFILEKVLTIVIGLLTWTLVWNILVAQIVKKVLTNGKLMVRFRGTYSTWAMFNVVLCVPAALMGAIVRIIKGLAFFILFFPRLDFHVYPDVVAKQDAGVTAFWSMMLVENMYNNPTMLVFLAHVFHAARLGALKRGAKFVGSTPPVITDGTATASSPINKGNTPSSLESPLISKPGSNASGSKDDSIFSLTLPPNAWAVYDAMYPSVAGPPAKFPIPSNPSRKVQHRFWLWWILYKNPSLRRFRKQLMTGNTDDDKKDNLDDDDKTEKKEDTAPNNKRWNREDMANVLFKDVEMSSLSPRSPTGLAVYKSPPPFPTAANHMRTSMVSNPPPPPQTSPSPATQPVQPEHRIITMADL
eukprot:PhF_6_TR7853/c1_g1_i1/m.11456